METTEKKGWNKLSKTGKGIVLFLGGVILFFGIAWISPALRVSESKDLEALQLDNTKIDNVTKNAILTLPETEASSDVKSLPLVRIAEYAWNGNSGMIAANGGAKTTKNSLMEKFNVNLEIVQQDMVGELRNMQIKFVEEFDKGSQTPTSEKSAPIVSIMGDGAPFYVTTLQQAIDEKFGKNKYTVQVIGAIGASYGEDKLIGPRLWKDNPQSMKGSLISTVVGDGDHMLALNFIFSNKGLKVNPDVTTYDPEAVNFIPSENDDYINSVKELIKSQNAGFTVPLKEVKDGKLTGKTINKKIDGATTWTPGDKIAFDALTGFTDVVSTKDYINQMATTLITIKEWALANEKTVVNMLKATYTANNQIKQYDSWSVRASEAVANTYSVKDAKYWYDMFKGQKKTKNNLDYNLGGTRVLTYADALQYYGIGNGEINRYKAVYEQISSYLTELNPCGFNENCKDGVIPYSNAVNTYFLSQVGNDIDAGKVEKIDYSSKKTEVMAIGQWHITFATGSAEILETKDLETIYNLLTQAETTKLDVTGFTDATGNANSNITLSKQRAESVVQWLKNRGISSSRFQSIDGKGSANPVADNKTSEGKAKNRRVEIALLK